MRRLPLFLSIWMVFHLLEVVEATNNEIWDYKTMEANATETACVLPDGRHMIYCSGHLLAGVMFTRLHFDSKTFVDRSIKESESLQTLNETLVSSGFNQYPLNLLSVKSLNEELIDKYFDVENKGLEKCKLGDRTENPPKIAAIKDEKLRNFALELNKIWMQLCRKVIGEINTTSRYSLIYLPNRFILPGGRYRENYYWDTYWIIRGLLVSGMEVTAKGMIENISYMIDQFGFVPSGGRIYYLKRSQPPMFCGMVYEYFKATNDVDFIQKNIDKMEKEMEFWEKNRKDWIYANFGVHRAYLYKTEMKTARPEAYRTDILFSAQFETLKEKKDFFQNMASATESGWDFSTRWLRDKSTLSSIETTQIVPVDLNAIMCWNMRIIAELYGKIGDTVKQTAWKFKHTKCVRNFQKIFYVKEAKGWYDVNLRTKKHNLDYYGSMVVPIFTQCFDTSNTKLVTDFYDKLEEMGVFKYPGGISASLYNDTHLKWDFPNGWAPVNHMLIEGLRQSNNTRMQQKAFELAEKWVATNLRVFEKTNAMYNSYDVRASDEKRAGVGQLDEQVGYGWTNAVILDLLSTYSDRMTYDSILPTATEATKKEETVEDAGNRESFFVSTLVLVGFVLN